MADALVSLKSDAADRSRAGSVKSIECELDGCDDEQERSGFGQKSITWWGSFALNLNNCMGPAMVLLPLVNQQAGWFTPTLALTVVYVLSSLAATMLCDAMQRIPGNAGFEHRYEFATTVLHYYGRKPYIAFQIFYNISMQASNIAAMIISAQVIDQFFSKLGGHSYALDFEHMKFIKSTGVPTSPWCEKGYFDDGDCALGHELSWVISVGYLLAMGICIPFGYMNLDDNMTFQWISMVGLVLFTVEFWFQWAFKMDGEDKVCSAIPENNTCDYLPNSTQGNFSYTKNGYHRTPFYQPSMDGQAQVVGIAVFAYAYVVTIPSWVNEKKPEVGVNSAIWVPATVGLFMKIASGLLGAWAYQLTMYKGNHLEPRGDPDATDILNLLMLRDQPEISQYSAYLWDLTTLIPGIPILGIMIRYNLLSGNVCGPFWSFFFGVVFPWIVTAFCYEQDVLTTLCNWVAIICSGYINFVVPAMLYHTALSRYPDKACPWGELPDGLVDDDDELFVPGRASSKTSGKSWFSYKPRSRLSSKSSKDSFGDDGAEAELLPINAETGMVEKVKVYTPVCAVPKSVNILGWRIKVNRAKVAVFLGVFFAVMSTLSIFLSIWSSATDGGAGHAGNQSQNLTEVFANRYQPALQKPGGNRRHWRAAEDMEVFGPDWR